MCMCMLLMMLLSKLYCKRARHYRVVELVCNEHQYEATFKTNDSNISEIYRTSNIYPTSDIISDV